ncbi:MAG TPA: ATP-dependent DNA helicase RecG [Verrucomicrobiae bacterium]|jgi:ATP-dependent DNA helicase RecG|nr:ATP-dependent DNA helicase RecG [Verrucomicrobiae bacterium]
MQEAPTQAPNLRYLKGIGPKRALILEKLGVCTLRDLFYYFPRRYEDRSHLRPIEEVRAGEPVTLKGTVLSTRLKRFRGISILEVHLGDKTGMIPAVWFNQPYLQAQFEEGREVIFFGKPDLRNDRLQMNSPEFEILDPEEEAVHTGRITPIYPLTEGLYQKTLRGVFHEAVQQHLDGLIAEYLPEDFRETRGLLPLPQAVREMHFPSSQELLDKARHRIVFDEFFVFQVLLFQKLELMKARHKAQPLRAEPAHLEEFRSALPFQLTSGQEEALSEIAAELALEIPMNRLLMGDVGSGKTVLGAFVMFLAAKLGRQAVMLVPTEILANQHLQTLKKLLQPAGITVKMLSSATAPAVREKMLAELKQGKLSCAIGTHALLQEDVRFASLAAVVIDEQHKFGVYQRCQLLNRELRPHQLVMTATPIPRTLALTVYGDLSVSAVKTLPAGRQPIKTYWITRQKQPEVLRHMLEKIKKGEQAYFIYPLIDETEKSDMRAATAGYDALRKGPFKDAKVGLVHGRMPGEERDAIMRDFKDGKIQALVATSVVEVGVDNPNATMMVIENAERFGLSQLHQMRGRVGRGQKPSECFLFGEPTTDEGKKRLRIMTKTQDGFVIAEEDLKLRGPGDFLGTRQSGEPLFRVAHPVLDQEILLEARAAATEVVKGPDWEQNPRWAALKKFLDHFPIRY